MPLLAGLQEMPTGLAGLKNQELALRTDMRRAESHQHYYLPSGTARTSD
jgi:hypothetical protein